MFFFITFWLKYYLVNVPFVNVMFHQCSVSSMICIVNVLFCRWSSLSWNHVKHVHPRASDRVVTLSAKMSSGRPGRRRTPTGAVDGGGGKGTGLRGHVGLRRGLVAPTTNCHTTTISTCQLLD